MTNVRSLSDCDRENANTEFEHIDEKLLLQLYVYETGWDN